MSKPITDYESEVEYWADQPTYKVVLFGLAMMLLIAVINLVKRN